MSEMYSKEVVLPSKGYFYDGQIPGGIVSIEPMGTKEEKILASAASGNRTHIINKLFDSCIASPLPHLQLVLGDRMYLLLQLRSISYGAEYRYPFRCSECGNKGWGSLNLDEIPVRYAKGPEGFLFPVKLPLSGTELEVRLLTGEDELKTRQYTEQLERHADKARTKAPVETSYVYRLARRIESIDGNKAGIREAMELVESLKGRDSLHLRDEIDSNDIGPEMEVESECSRCGYLNGPFVMPFDSEFFRPRRRNSRPADHLRAAESIERTGQDLAD